MSGANKIPFKAVVQTVIDLKGAKEAQGLDTKQGNKLAKQEGPGLLQSNALKVQNESASSRPRASSLPRRDSGIDMSFDAHQAKMNSFEARQMKMEEANMARAERSMVNGLNQKAKMNEIQTMEQMQTALMDQQMNRTKDLAKRISEMGKPPGQ